MHNARENLVIMNAMQTVQNKQNQALLQQVRKLPQPQPAIPNEPSFTVEEGVFEQLDELED